MSLKFIVHPVTELRQNCTMMWCDETMVGVMIDPGGDVELLQALVRDTGVTLEKILLTHGHFDHVGGTMKLAAAFDLPIFGPHKEDEFLLQAVTKGAGHFGLEGFDDVQGNSWLDEGDVIEFGNQTLNILHTPGHTPGHLIFYNVDAKIAQVGDVLFKGAIGRTDFPRGDFDTLIHSITTKLWPLGGDMEFIPGHGRNSTFGEERATNSYVADRVLNR